MKKGVGGRLIKCMGVVLCLLLACFNSGEQMRYVRGLGSSISAGELDGLKGSLGAAFSLRLDGVEGIYAASSGDETLNEARGRASIRLFGAIPLKELSFGERPEIWVMPGGIPIGVSIYADGALVVGLGSVVEGEQNCPAAEAGIRAGDVITAVNGETVENSAHLGRLCAGGGPLSLSVLRDGKVGEYVVNPVYNSEADAYMAGMWVRDSTSGIGTLSFYNLATGRYGALGHPITDVDTGSIISVREGKIVESSIIGVSAGSSGAPGEVIGSFSPEGRAMGSIELNCGLGVYGEALDMPVNPLYPDGALIAYPDEIYEGEAQILSAVDGEVKAYSCEILKLYHQDEPAPKGMVIKVTDSSLIEKTGGIVQGMSGSPVMQDGRLAGVVTHVFVNDARCGYCIYALWMDRVANGAVD